MSVMIKRDMATSSILQMKESQGIAIANNNQKTMPIIPNEILKSKLMIRGGFDVFEGIIDETIKRELLNEAIKQKEFLMDSLVENNDKEEVRGGTPKRKFLSSSGGLYQERFYKSEWVLDFLRDLTTPFLKPTGEQGTYTYYSREGDYLDIHRDIVECDIAVISCLLNENKADNLGGYLCLYPDRMTEPLSHIRATPNKGAVKILLEEGQTIVMYGGYIPHTLLPVSKGQNRVVSVLCYRVI